MFLLSLQPFKKSILPLKFVQELNWLLQFSVQTDSFVDSGMSRKEKIGKSHSKSSRRNISLADGFPNPKALVNELHLNGFKAIWMLDPGLSTKGTQWLHRRVEVDGYEEYSEVEYNPVGCTGEYTVIE
ncbi:hypothetical protein Syun_001576 [Stephania yunnanensis]|uniref:Uncharacterized protein n=1 Tax=Stephania yunnanensis TaxID=152371 RepID=A0AAP0QB16_9MAGN